MLRTTVMSILVATLARAQETPKQPDAKAPEVHILKSGETLVLRNPDGTITQVAGAPESANSTLFNSSQPFDRQWSLLLGQTDSQNAEANTMIGVRFGGVQRDFALGAELLYGRVTENNSIPQPYSYQHYVPGHYVGKIWIKGYDTTLTGTRMVPFNTTLTETLLGSYISLGRFTTAFGGWNCKADTPGFGGSSETKFYGGVGYRFSNHFGLMVYARQNRSLFTVTYAF